MNSTKRITSALLAAFLLTSTMWAQQVPQFSSSDYEDWTYNNPGIELNSSTITGGKIVLYTNSQGRVLTLTSPLFECQGIDSIEANVLWYTKEFKNSAFDLSRTALTMVLDNEQGTPLDSVTAVPTVAQSTHTLTLRLAVPTGTTQARLRFVSWLANIISSGAVKQADITGIAATTPPDEPLVGDVDGNGLLNVSDVTLLIQSAINSIDVPNGDIDGNGEINVSDITLLINLLMSL